MKLKTGYVLHEIAGEYMVLPERSVDLSSLLSLNETGAFLWRKLETQTDEQALVAALTEEFAVETSAAKQDVHDFILRLEELGLLE